MPFFECVGTRASHRVGRLPVRGLKSEMRSTEDRRSSSPKHLADRSLWHPGLELRYRRVADRLEGRSGDHGPAVFHRRRRMGADYLDRVRGLDPAALDREAETLFARVIQAYADLPHNDRYQRPEAKTRSSGPGKRPATCGAACGTGTMKGRSTRPSPSASTSRSTCSIPRA